MSQLLKKIFHKPDKEAEKKIEKEITENEKKRQELYRRLHAVEVTMPVRPRRRTGGSHR